MSLAVESGDTTPCRMTGVLKRVLVFPDVGFDILGVGYRRAHDAAERFHQVPSLAVKC